MPLVFNFLSILTGGNTNYPQSSMNSRDFSVYWFLVGFFSSLGSLFLFMSCLALSKRLERIPLREIQNSVCSIFLFSISSHEFWPPWLPQILITFSSPERGCRPLFPSLILALQAVTCTKAALGKSQVSLHFFFFFPFLKNSILQYMLPNI